MFRQRRWLRCAMILLIAVLCCGYIFAQQGGGDDPMQVQQRPRPIMKYTVASPRACLVGSPVLTMNAYDQPSGDAVNFARADSSLRVPLGVRVVFCLSRELEGVWYPRTYGMLGTSLAVQWCRYCKCEASTLADCVCSQCGCEACRALGIECEPGDDATEVVRCPWVTIGRDGARDVRKGPSIGRAKVGVPVYFRRPGVYYLRAIVRTVAQPYYPGPVNTDDPVNDGSIVPPIALADAYDVVHIRVHVVDLPIDQVGPDEDATEDPDVDHIRPMPKDVDPDAIEPDPAADLNGDDVVNMGDLAILSQQWGSEYVMPLKDDE